MAARLSRVEWALTPFGSGVGVLCHSGSVGRGPGTHDRRKFFELVHALIVHVPGFHLTESRFVFPFDLGRKRGHEAMDVDLLALRTGGVFLPGSDGLEEFKLILTGVAAIFIDGHGSPVLPLLRIDIGRDAGAIIQD